MNKSLYLKALEKIIVIRNIELNIAKTYKEKKIFSFLHLCIGQEASAVGVAMATDNSDVFFGNHRSHGHYIAKGGDIKSLIYECFGDPRGTSKGQGGSMHLIDNKVNFLGSIAILGSGPSIASGIAMAKKLENKKSIVVVFVGDGSAEEGCFYETINMAGLYKLPLLVVIEDNKYAVESSAKKRKVNKYNYKKIFKEGLNVEYIRANGNDFEKVYKNTKILKKNILSKKKIGILHLDCIRHAKHSGTNISEADQKSNYRFKGEFDKIKMFDPINLTVKKLLKLNIKEAQIEFFKKKIQKKVNDLYLNTLKNIKIRKL